MSGDPWSYIIGAVATIIGAVLLYKGSQVTASKANEGVNRTADVSAQDSALSAWKDLLEPYRERIEELGKETTTLRQDLRIERQERAARESTDADDRAREKRKVQEQMDALTERIDLLKVELTQWKRVARTIARWATALRDEVLRLGGTVPATPDELLTLNAIDEMDDD